MSKRAIFDKEKQKLLKIFEEVEESKKKLVEGLIEEAAFLQSENFALKEILSETGMINVHPENKALQKNVPAAGQYLKNVNSYAVIIKTLNGVLLKHIPDDDDDMSDFE